MDEILNVLNKYLKLNTNYFIIIIILIILYVLQTLGLFLIIALICKKLNEINQYIRTLV
jgi:hypothetical protein